MIKKIELSILPTSIAFNWNNNWDINHLIPIHPQSVSFQQTNSLFSPTNLSQIGFKIKVWESAHQEDSKTPPES